MTQKIQDTPQGGADGKTQSTPKAPWPSMPHIPVAWGEVFDKLTILEIKRARLADPRQRVNVDREYAELHRVIGLLERFPAGLSALLEQLKSTNDALWDIEEGKRACERRQVFDADFIELARQVYLQNDQRAAIKRQINTLLGSALVEEKSHRSRSLHP
jgi:hypothetical protein